jgi:hypothetical protein
MPFALQPHRFGDFGERETSLDDAWTFTRISSEPIFGFLASSISITL